MTGRTVLFVDDEAHLRLAAKQTLELAGLDAQVFDGAEAALVHIARDFPGVLVTDIRMAGMDGLALMKQVLEIDPDFPVILVTGHGDVELAVQSLRAGAYDFIEKPFASERLIEAVRRALDKRRLTIENRVLRRQVGRRDAVESRLTGRSAAMDRLRAELRAIAQTDADVLIVGETGTGKEEVARALHRVSNRNEKPFLHINCAALPAELIESELFGHEAGAFPGAIRTRYGKLEHGRGGTVFLDEIDSLPMAVQGKLLDVIHTRSITPLGTSEPVELDVRFVAASKVDLEQAASQGAFRADLMYRIAVTTLRVPPLSERREDIPNLFLHLVDQAAARHKRSTPDVPAAVLAQVAARDWPGNVRELRNAADRYALGLDLNLGPQDSSETAEPSLADRMAGYEKSLISASLTAHGGSIADTYRALGVSRRTLYEKMQKHGLDRADYRDDD
ncbi:sigma-54-dependent transcriptional regulator [Qingshengfaniella alkalisoli]|uniref:Nif-specific regulatory protein n=1 Tax=Qingshengfaniella alkalisoli TaxID=2599296 RepID=A0A5B8IBD6_9RHOB|nr:sigma-54 dependent transcriptional regulator [Qingshengfaniella alkalisoli]QDY70736.1 sigma-54-dependent Fis family transcriptional regulator [Qingshengfaniella alkalisoli]